MAEVFDEFPHGVDDLQSVFPYMLVYSKTPVRVARLDVFNASLLTTAVSNFEVLVSNLVKDFLKERQALRSDDSRHSLAEISAYESLAEFRDFAEDDGPLIVMVGGGSRRDSLGAMRS